MSVEQADGPVLLWESLKTKCEATSWFNSYKAERARVPGGWLVLSTSNAGQATAMAFLPDPDHKWDGGSPT
jgi:hypothetical protein